MFKGNQESTTKLTEQKIIECLSAEQDGDADLFSIIHKEKLVYDHGSRNWYHYKGHCWELDKKDLALAAVKEVAGEYAKLEKELPINTDKEKDEYYKKVRKDIAKKLKSLRHRRWKQDVLTLSASGEEGLGITGSEWDQNPNLLGVANGVVDLTTGKLIPGRPDQYIKTTSLTRYVEDAPEPQSFIIFLYQIFAGDQEVIKYVQRLIGSALLGRVREHILIIFVGVGRNGKSTLLEIIAFVLGPHAGALKSSLLLDQGRLKSSSSPNPDIIDLKGKRFVWAAETNPDSRIDPGMVKWLTGGDTLVGRPLWGKHEIRFEPSHTMILMTNNMPKVPDAENDFGFWQRIHILNFTQSFVDEPRRDNHHRVDKDLPEKLKREAEGILAWMVRGCLEYQREGLNPPKVIKDAVDCYRREEEVVSRFLDECCIYGNDYRVGADELYTTYCAWTKFADSREMKQKEFGERMTRLNIKKMHSNGIKYLGIKLKNENLE